MNGEKKKLEKAACRYFLDAYNRKQDTHFEILRHSDRPDFVVQDGSKTLGIEITHLYYGDEEAMELLGKLDKPSPQVQIFPTLVENLNALLADKAKQARGYNVSHPVILVIRAASPVFDDEDFNHLDESIMVPESLFREIWLLARDDQTGNWVGLKRLK